jgi:hypothetical protein
MTGHECSVSWLATLLHIPEAPGGIFLLGVLIVDLYEFSYSILANTGIMP